MRAGRKSSQALRRRVLSYTTALLLGCACLSAQSAPPLQFTRLAAEDGLSQGGVMAISQDSQGFLWLGTEDGLDRYDGYEVRHFIHDRTQPRSLPTNWVSTLVQDRTGTLWIGTAGGGVVGRNPNTGALLRLGARGGDRAASDRAVSEGTPSGGEQATP